MQKNVELGTAPVGKLLRKLAVPTITAQLVNMLYNLVDRIYIGHIPEIGTAALTGVGVCLPVIMMLSAFAALAAAGGAPLASIAMGQGDNDKAEKIMGSCAGMLVLISLTLTAVLIFFRDPILLLFGASQETLVYASRYMSVYCLGTIFVLGTLGLNPYVTAQGFSTVSMYTVLIGAILNTILDPIFIFLLKLDVMGAAMATIISQCVSCLWVTRFLTGKKTILRLKVRNMKPNWSLLAPCIALGLSPFIMYSTESVLSMCFNVSLRNYGGDIAVGTMTILASVMQLAMLPLQGLTQGAQPILSYNYGARNAQRVKDTFFLLLKTCVAFSLTLWLLSMVAPGMFIGLFTPDPALKAYAIPCLRIYMAVSLLFGVQIGCQQTFVALGNAKHSLFLACLRKLILLIPLIFLLPNLFPANKVYAVFTAEPVADFLAVVCTASLFASQFRKALKAMEQPAVAK